MVTARRIAEAFRTVVIVLSRRESRDGRDAVPAAEARRALAGGAARPLAGAPTARSRTSGTPSTGPLARGSSRASPAGCTRVTGLSHDEGSKVAYSSGVHQRSSAMRSRKLAVLQSLLMPPPVYGDARGRPAHRRVGEHQGRDRGGRGPGARRGHPRLVAAPALPLAARARPQGDLLALQEGHDGRDQLQRRTGRSVHHRGEPAPRPARLAAARRDARGRGLLDARAGRAASPRLDPRRDPRPRRRGEVPHDRRLRAPAGARAGASTTSEYEISDYEGARARWCPGCGDHSILTAVQKLLAAEQLTPEQTMFVSGIGCSSRFPHYLKTYGFHGIHGRALPVATGIKLTPPRPRRLRGDGRRRLHLDRRRPLGARAPLQPRTSRCCCSTTASTASPRTRRRRRRRRDSRATRSRTAAGCPPLNPLSVALGVTNASFVAQTAEWIPRTSTRRCAPRYQHHGLSFVRILQRCPIYTPARLPGGGAGPGATSRCSCTTTA